MIVCEECVKLGSIYWETRPQARTKRVARPPPLKVSTRKPTPTITEDLELVEDFSSRVRKARENMGLSHEDLGRKIGEKVSVLQKIETGKMTPDHKLADKLQHALKVRLLVPPSEPKPPSMGLTPPHEVTLGEIVHLKKRKGEVAEEREPS